MKYTKDRYLDTDIHFVEQENELIGLGQVDKLTKLSSIYYNNIRPTVSMNCSYFFTENNKNYAVGRNQGDSYDDRPDDAGYCLVLKDGVWSLGEFKSWEYEKAEAGFTVATILIKDGIDVELTSSLISDSKTKLTVKQPQTALGITNDNKAVFFVSEGRNSNDKGISGLELRTYLKGKMGLKYLVQLDGGGSSELIINGQIKNYLSDGAERPMLNALCMYNEPFKPTIPNVNIKYPCFDGWGSHKFEKDHEGLDFGWDKEWSLDVLGKSPIYACDDGEVVFEGYYPQIINGIKYKPIGVILKHNWADTDYYSIYWHLSKTIVNKGDIVLKGQQIGNKGNTGLSKGTHLHFQILNLPKGMDIPDQHNPDNTGDVWAKYSIDPTSLIEVYEGQHYKYELDDGKYSQFNLRYHEDEPDIEELKTRIIELENYAKELQDDIVTLEDEKKVLIDKIDKVKEVLYE